MFNDTAIAQALEQAAGRSHDEPSRVPALLLAWAHRLIDARRAVLAAEPAPSAARACARRAFEARSAPSILARLLFDSGATAPAPTRGSIVGSRTRRYGAGGARLDVHVRSNEVGERVLQVAAVGPGGPLGVRIELPAADAPLELELDPFGTGRVLLDASVPSVVLIVSSDSRDVLKTLPIPLA